MFYGNLAEFGKKFELSFKVQFGNKVASKCNTISIEGITLYPR